MFYSYTYIIITTTTTTIIGTTMTTTTTATISRLIAGWLILQVVYTCPCNVGVKTIELNVAVRVKAKFSLVADRFEASRRPASSCWLAASELDDRPNSSSLQVCDQLQTCLRPNSVMEFGFTADDSYFVLGGRPCPCWTLKNFRLCTTSRSAIPAVVTTTMCCRCRRRCCGAIVASVHAGDCRSAYSEHVR